MIVRTTVWKESDVFDVTFNIITIISGGAETLVNKTMNLKI